MHQLNSFLRALLVLIFLLFSSAFSLLAQVQPLNPQQQEHGQAQTGDQKSSVVSHFAYQADREDMTGTAVYELRDEQGRLFDNCEIFYNRNNKQAELWIEKNYAQGGASGLLLEKVKFENHYEDYIWYDRVYQFRLHKPEGGIPFPAVFNQGPDAELLKQLQDPWLQAEFGPDMTPECLPFLHSLPAEVLRYMKPFTEWTISYEYGIYSIKGDCQLKLTEHDNTLEFEVGRHWDIVERIIGSKKNDQWKIEMPPLWGFTDLQKYNQIKSAEMNAKGLTEEQLRYDRENGIYWFPEIALNAKWGVDDPVSKYRHTGPDMISQCFVYTSWLPDKARVAREAMQAIQAAYEKTGTAMFEYIDPR